MKTSTGTEAGISTDTVPSPRPRRVMPPSVTVTVPGRSEPGSGGSAMVMVRLSMLRSAPLLSGVVVTV
jgi:hypothetical protein